MKQTYVTLNDGNKIPVDEVVDTLNRLQLGGVERFFRNKKH